MKTRLHNRVVVSGVSSIVSIRFRSIAFLAPAFLLAFAPTPGTAQYIFIEIARAGSSGPGPHDFAEFQADSSGYYVSLNNSGTVAFRAGTFTSGVNGVYSGSGGPITTIVEAGGTNVLAFLGGQASINSSGQVAFWAATPALADFVIDRGNGLTTTQIVSRVAQGYSSLGDGPSINSSGIVAFRASPASGVYLGSGGSVTPLYSNGDGIVLDVASDSTFNDAGQVVFIGTKVGGDQGMFRGSGGALTTMALNSTSGGPFSGYPGGVGSMNSNGVVAFDAFLTAGGEGIFTSTGTGLPTTIADTSGPFDDFKGSPAISLYGLAFTASLDAGGTGIFNGSDPTNKVIQVGDPLLGSTVASIQSLGRYAINDSGEIAFVATLADGDSVVVRATPGVRPTLRAFLTGTNSAVVAWPSPSTGFKLQQNADLTTTNWADVTNAAGIVGSEKQVTFSPPSGNNHFRLIYP